ncbi:MAG: hydrogenase maturation protease [Caldilinea sp.]|nr:hydrogenase maturation protease [Caldilinea sp.]MDW8442160.1 hydrogenase maturation protease [Caldilineaceae bacterium]
MQKTLVLGIGNLWRGDDAVGLLAAQALQAHNLPDVTVMAVSKVDPFVIPLWQGFDRLILIDAVVSGAAPGAVHWFDLSKESLPATVSSCSTHSFDLAALIELARTLQKLPPEVWLFGVEGRDLSYGRPVCKAVMKGLESCIDMIVKRLQAPPNPR